MKYLSRPALALVSGILLSVLGSGVVRADTTSITTLTPTDSPTPTPEATPTPTPPALPTTGVGSETLILLVAVFGISTATYLSISLRQK